MVDSGFALMQRQQQQSETLNYLVTTKERKKFCKRGEKKIRFEKNLAGWKKLYIL
jgi:hypothetical protein